MPPTVGTTLSCVCSARAGRHAHWHYVRRAYGQSCDSRRKLDARKNRYNRSARNPARRLWQQCSVYISARAAVLDEDRYCMATRTSGGGRVCAADRNPASRTLSSGRPARVCPYAGGSCRHPLCAASRPSCVSPHRRSRQASTPPRGSGRCACVSRHALPSRTSYTPYTCGR